MLTDYHTHTWRCGHATGTMEQYAEAAIARGITELGLTDHLWLYWLPESERSREWAIPESMYDEHYAEMVALRDRYRGRLNVRVSVEADFVEGHARELHTILGRYEFDYVLGSVHFMDGWMIDAPEYQHVYREKRVVEIYRRYYENVRRALETGEFDVLAHLDLPKKFGYLPEEDLQELTELVLDDISAAGVVVEVSTAGLRKPIGEIYPSEGLLHGMAARNIPIVLSSDAHDPSEVGYAYDTSLELVRRLGWTQLATFEGRHRTMREIRERSEERGEG